MNSSEILEEILYECHELKIIDEVRKEANKILLSNEKVTLLEAYESAYYKILNNPIHKTS